jgi:hypothetical protein
MSFKKGINEFINSLEVGEAYPGMNDDFAKLPDERRYEILGLVEEAKVEYPKYEDYDGQERLDDARYKWFVKWFGDG